MRPRPEMIARNHAYISIKLMTVAQLQCVLHLIALWEQSLVASYHNFVVMLKTLELLKLFPTLEPAMRLGRPKSRLAPVMHVHRAALSVLAEKRMSRPQNHRPRVLVAQPMGVHVEGRAAYLWAPREGSSTFA
jgi:hypothetical protein